MTDAIVSLAVQKLGDFLLQNIVDRKNFRTNLEWLRAELGYMRSFIQDAEEKQGPDRRMQQWISEITDLAGETVTILDDFNLKMGGRKSGFANSLRMCACICSREADLCNYGQRIESLRKKVDDVSRKRETYGIRNLSYHSAGEGPSRGPNNRSSIVKTLRRATSYVDQDPLFVGFEDVTQTLLGELLKMEPRRSVISIYGMGGLGKTTIARELYNSSHVMANFPYRAWVCVSQEYRTSDLLRSLIKSFRKMCFKDELKMIEGMEEEDLERYLRDILKDHKYLAVVDDVWHKEAWESLKRAFPDDKNGSRVIITTRKKDVATRVDDRSFVHELRFLTPEESGELFYKKISHGKCSAAMQNLGKEMVEKCGGLPLAILVRGGLLCHKSLPEWQEVKKNIWRQLKNDSLEISCLLSLSYDDLPGELKKCFLYVGGFLEDCLIDVEKLKWLWMAEGFITSREARMEDMADHYLNELINRSMIQIAETIWDKYANCRIHDLLRDLAVQKAIEVNFFDIHDPRKYFTHPPGRRHVVHRQIENYFSLALTKRETQSLVIFNPDYEKSEFKHLKSLCGNFKNLCVLHLENCIFKNFGILNKKGQLPDDIGNLIHLKFLGIIHTNILHLPSSLGKLKSLETIFAKETTLVFPPQMSELKNLRHLVALCSGPVNISSLTNLETLKYVKADDWLKMDTTNLFNLQELVIWKADSHCNLDSIGKLRSLTTLTLTCFGPNSSISSLEPLSSCQSLLRLWLGGRIPNPGQLKNLPESIMFLILQNSGLREDPMAVLETFPNLQNLELWGAYEGDTITCTAKGFPELELLRFRDLVHLRNWQLEDEAMPMIKGLGIFKCPSLVVPERFNHISKLKEMENRPLP